MIIRRTTRVAAGLRCQGAQRGSAPERRPRGPAKRGSGSGGDARPHQNTDGAPTARYGVASSFGRHCSRPTRSPQSVARGAPRSGDRAAAGMPDRTKIPMGRLQPATGSHLPSEDTAPALRGLPRASPEGPREAGIGVPTRSRPILPHTNEMGFVRKFLCRFISPIDRSGIWH
jgi:hypothetical protein